MPRKTRHIASSITIILFGILILIWIVFAATGSDPFQLFTPAQPTSTPTSTSAYLPVYTDTPVIVPPAITYTPNIVTPTDTATISGALITVPPIPTTSWWEVYFTEPLTINDSANFAASIEELLITYINSARTSIHIASFEFDLTPVAEALIAAHGRGVDVRWVTDNEHGLQADAKAGRGQFAMLQQAGIQVRDDGRGALMHNKFWIFDGQTVWTGSTNITVSGIFKQNNNAIVIHSPAVAAMYENEFAEMWAGQFGPKSPSTASQQTTFVDSAPVGVLFASEDKVISRIVPLLQNAQASIRFLAFSFTHDALGMAMLERARSGVDVRGVFEKTGSRTIASEMGRLYCASVPVRQDGNPEFLHDKIIVIDSQIVITGSLNYSENADENDENVIIIGNADIAALYLQEFERLWAQASEPVNVTCP